MGLTMNLKSAISSAEKILEQPTRCEEFAEFVAWRMLRFRFQELLHVATGSRQGGSSTSSSQRRCKSAASVKREQHEEPKNFETMTTNKQQA